MITGVVLKKGIIFLNMGGPNNLDEVEVFLKNMFNDKNILNIKCDILRKFVAYVIVKLRTKQAKENYRLIGSKSPIIDNTKLLLNSLKPFHENTILTYAMTYTPPFCKQALMQVKDCEQLTIVPLYPHYSTTTIKSSLQDFNLNLQKSNYNFKIKIVKEFFYKNLYNQALLKSIQKSLKNDQACKFDLIYSAHSLPQKIIKNGDPYEKHIKAHVKILNRLLEKNNLHFNQTHLAYQSKLGPVKWLEPELGKVLKRLTNKKAIILPLSFCIDNSETKYELQIEYKNIAHELNFIDYRVCECPNHSHEFIKFLNKILLKH